MHHANVFTTVFRLDSYPQNTVLNEHGAWKDGDGAGDQKNSKGRVPKQAQGNPILSY